MGGAIVRHSGTRAGDADRERAVRSLRAHFAAGRLDERELERRVELACRAATTGDLRRLFADLPRGTTRRLRRRVRRQQALLHAHGITSVALNSSAIGTWLVTGAGAFWPAATLLPSAVLFLWHARSVRRERRRLTSSLR